MAVNRGKDFEAQFKDAFLKVKNVSFDRLPDPAAGYAGVRNICDFCVYFYPHQYFIECKAIRENTLNFKSHISVDQWNGLFIKSKIPGVCAGVCVWFIDHDITAFVEIQTLHELADNGQKSLNVKQLLNNTVPHIVLQGRKKRILYEYNVLPFITDLAALAAKTVHTVEV